MFKNVYAVWRLNLRTGFRHLESLFDSESLANDMCSSFKHSCRKKYICYYVEDCSFSYGRYLVDDNLITRCFNIANCFELAERALKKNDFITSSYWFVVAKERSIQCASILYAFL